MTLVIFIVGVIVFSLTVWGAVMAGGIALSRIEIEQDPELKKRVDEGELEKRFPIHVKY